MKKTSGKNSNRKFINSLNAKRNEVNHNLAKKLEIERRLRNLEIHKNAQENYKHKEELLNEYNQWLKEESKRKDTILFGKVVVIALVLIFACAFFVAKY